MTTVRHFKLGRVTEEQADIVQETPIVLHVNGRELATLVASPHDLRALVVGFLRLQGFISTLDDFNMLAVCQDHNIANALVKKELPERLKPILTSGCGTGITFSLPGGAELPPPVAATPLACETIFRLMEEMAKRSELYRSHGGIHSAAIGTAAGIELFAEDIGRHNTLDRIAGTALLQGVNLSGKLLITSGRISAEMAGKAALLGVSLIASRTSPTNMALTICQQAGIALVGYVRASSFTVYADPQGILPLPPA